MFKWAKIVVTLERAVPQKAARNYLEEYSIQLAPGDDVNPEQRGFMVIKCKSQTRAKQRKGAVINWKVFASTETRLFLKVNNLIPTHILHLIKIKQNHILK